MRALPFLLVPVLLAPVAAQAQDLAESHFSMNFCWERTYSTAHLAEHAEQTVSSIRLSREPAGHPSAPGELPMELSVTFRGEDGGRAGEQAVAIGACAPDGEALRCRLEGDAGTYSIETQGRELLLTVGEGGMTFETRDAFRELRADAGDDRAFLLRRCG